MEGGETKNPDSGAEPAFAVAGGLRKFAGPGSLAERLAVPAAAAPLVTGLFIVIRLYDGFQGRRRDEFLVLLAASLALQAVCVLLVCRIASQRRGAAARRESDLRAARNIQNRLLPSRSPDLPGLDFRAAYRPAREIGGDYYDFLPVGDHRLAVIVADASGQYIPAALVMATARAALRAAASGSASPARALTRVNAALAADLPRGVFVTAHYLVLDSRDNSMLCASAGHPPLLLARRDGTVEAVNPGGIALGFDSGPLFRRSIRERRVGLGSGDRAVIYTDGVSECANAAREEYSERRLIEFVRRTRELSNQDFIAALLADLDRHRGGREMLDDATVVAFSLGAPPAGTPKGE